MQGNNIGLDVNGNALGNNQDGVVVSANADANRIENNSIAFNTGNGVIIPNVTGGSDTVGIKISIVDNAIFSNGAPGIDLGTLGVTPNDPGDADIGPNFLQNFPVLTAATSRAEPALKGRNSHEARRTSMQL